MTPDRPGGRTGPTDEVGDEGGSPGDMDVDRSAVTSGSEATSTVAAEDVREEERRHEETGEGRRSP
jgi:hypothetical protein